LIVALGSVANKWRGIWPLQLEQESGEISILELLDEIELLDELEDDDELDEDDDEDDDDDELPAAQQSANPIPRNAITPGGSHKPLR
jgi:hypothetical protein